MKDELGIPHGADLTAELHSFLVYEPTRRQGRPYTLVLTKTDALFTADLQRRSNAAADLDWLAAEWSRTE